MRGEARETASSASGDGLERDSSVGPYRLLRVLGTGGMGVVYLAERRRPRARVALKCLTALSGTVERTAQRFAAEVYVHGALRHPNIVRMLDHGASPERYLAMEHVEGCSVLSLWSWLHARGEALPIAACLRIGERAAAALAHAHGRRDASGRTLGIVHRDVSPSNVLVSRCGGVKLIDFGLARHRDRDWATTAGMTLGKVGYMPPEMLLGREVDARSDVYSLGVLLWECLTGTHLTPRGSLLRAAEHIVAGNHPSPSASRSGVPAAVDALLARILSTEPDERPSALEVARTLRALRSRAGTTELARSVRRACRTEVAPC